MLHAVHELVQKRKETITLTGQGLPGVPRALYVSCAEYQYSPATLTLESEHGCNCSEHSYIISCVLLQPRMPFIQQAPLMRVRAGRKLKLRLRAKARVFNSW
jgi:hypothetical protein